MKIVLVNTSDRRGGAAVACLRLAEALRKSGAEVNVLVSEKLTTLPYVTELHSSRWGKLRKKGNFLLERLEIFLQNKMTRKDLFAVSTAGYGCDISDYPLVKEADVVHLHWVNQGFLSLTGIGNLLATGKPVVWTLHDLWAVTGICHNPRACDRFQSDCGKCPQLHSETLKDLSSVVMARKKEFLCGAGIRLVSCSDWLGERARTSMLEAGNPIAAIPNPIDTAFFSPGDRVEARRALGLPMDKPLILFGAVIASDKRKGIDYLTEASLLLANAGVAAELVMCGEMKGEDEPQFGLPVHKMGYVSDLATIRLLYRAADLFVTPSLEENLPNMIMESMACGVPCVGFNVGGIPEMIAHRHNGYVAEYLSTTDLAEGIRYVLEHTNDPAFGESARRFVEEHYSEPRVAARYLDIYKESIEAKKYE